MRQRITAIYEDGVLRPLSQLELPEHSQVEIYIHQVSSATTRPAHRDQVNQALVKAGLSRPSTDTTTHAATQLSPERREELARLFSIGGPVSELISEDRGVADGRLLCRQQRSSKKTRQRGRQRLVPGTC
jgi:predicted DNA-binding antitoxin AbrB/MazE fold protein